MSNARFFAALVLTAIVAGCGVGAVTLSLPAHADAPRKAECKVFSLAAPGAVEAWMDAELAAGKASFFLAPGSMACAW